MNNFSAPEAAPHAYSDNSRRARTRARQDEHGIYLGHDEHGWRRRGTTTFGTRSRSAAVGEDVVAHHPERALARTARSSPHRRNPTSWTPPWRARSVVGACHLFDPTASVPDRAGVHRVRWSPLPACTSWRTALSTARSLVVVGSRTVAGTRRWPVPTGPSVPRHCWPRCSTLPRSRVRTCAPSSGGSTAAQALPAQQVLSGAGATIARDLLDGIVTTDERELSWHLVDGLGCARRLPLRGGAGRHRDPDFDPLAFVASTDTVYIAAPAHHQALVAPLVVGFLDEIRRATYNGHDRVRRSGPRWSWPSTNWPTSHHSRTSRR